MAKETENAPEQELPPDSAEPAKTDAEPAESESAESEKDLLPDDAITVEDVGTLRKKVTVRVDRRKIDGKFNEMFGELDRTAQVPGFRIGHAPRRLIEKRFGKDVADDVRNALVGETLGQALDQSDFKAIGEPDINLEDIELPESDDMTFSFEVEVAPQFDLPETKGIEITRRVFEVTDERVEDALNDYRREFGRLKPTDEPAMDGDLIVADVTIAGDGVDHKASNVELRVAPAQIEGVILEDLPKALAGRKCGQSANVSATVPAAHPNEQWREKEVTVTFELKEVKRLEVPELDEEFLDRAGFDSVEKLREALRNSLESRVSLEQKRALREEVCRHLLDNTSFDLPEDLVRRHADKVLSRRYVDLLIRGVSRDQIDQNLQQLRAAASEQAESDLRLSFILGKLAEAEGVEVDDGEVNARIAQIAARYNRRPERLRQEMAGDGSLDQLASSILEEKAVEKVLEHAKIVNAAPEKDDKPKTKSKADNKSGNKAGKTKNGKKRQT